ncbi:MAG: carbohydrate-binding module family 14 protein, partial [Shewanella sp.]
MKTFLIFCLYSERFYKCETGRAIEFQCPIGQHWNAARSYCDFPNNARCGATNQWPNQPNWNQPQPPSWNQPQPP